ncbi:TM2 domain-containing protein almondex [Cimex lectularius]|uniref:TM2 domain-containing protein n=1 Tax=Cimex lectularius TaxID=79782 RepID=A0A8I6RI85_CIMLE|nr:TM2 domain-containing protein almondex [Cimex lectularius]
MFLKLVFFIVLFLSRTSHNAQLTDEEDQNKIPDVNRADTTELSSVCPKVKCEQLNYPCITCIFNEKCVYGEMTTALCSPLINYCQGNTNGSFVRQFRCQYCYQTEKWEHNCVLKANCNSVSSPKSFYRTNCTVYDNILCLGRRTFLRNIPCNWTGGHRWSTAMLLSITLGGFGADRFYLGYWQEGIGKLFSFGGLGVWTVIDFILIAIQYLGPADGSLYI